MSSYFFEGMVSIYAYAESHSDDLFLFWGQCLQNHQYLVGYFISFRIRVWGWAVFVTDKIFQLSIFIANRSLKSYGVLYRPEYLFHFSCRHPKFFANFFIARLSPK